MVHGVAVVSCWVTRPHALATIVRHVAACTDAGAVRSDMACLTCAVTRVSRACVVYVRGACVRVRVSRRVFAQLEFTNQTDAAFVCTVHEEDGKFRHCKSVEGCDVPPQSDDQKARLVPKRHMGMSEGVEATFNVTCESGVIRVTVHVRCSRHTPTRRADAALTLPRAMPPAPAPHRSRPLATAK